MIILLPLETTGLTFIGPITGAIVVLLGIVYAIIGNPLLRTRTEGAPYMICESVVFAIVLSPFRLHGLPASYDFKNARRSAFTLS